MTNTFSIAYRYEVQFTHNVFAPGNATLANTISCLSFTAGPTPCLFLVDRGLAASTLRLCERVEIYARTYSSVIDLRMLPCVLPGGEGTKDGWATPSKVIDLARASHLCRHSLIIAVGGGAFLDAVGFAAAIFHRGTRVLRLPTTVLSQNDSGVGVKSGINLGHSKNLVGAFAPPAAVINDPLFLLTLSDRDWVAGIAEAYKVAAICDTEFLTWLDESAPRLRARDLDTMQRLIGRCAQLHCNHITEGGDPFEFGSSRPLDFGHWAAHKLEMMTDGDLRHGEAVAVGIALDLLYAAGRSFITTEEADATIRSMRRCGLPSWHDALAQCTMRDTPDVLDGIEEFRQHLGGVLHITFPSPLGQRLEVHHIDRSAMASAIAELKQVDKQLSSDTAPPDHGPLAVSI